MILTPEELDKKITEVMEFSDSHMGVKYGVDYQEMVMLLMQSKNFDTVASVNCLLVLLDTADARKIRDKYTNPMDPRAIVEVGNTIKKSAMESLASILYIGFQLGKREAELEILKSYITMQES